jgi:hypothetical protein
VKLHEAIEALELVRAGFPSSNGNRCYLLSDRQLNALERVLCAARSHDISQARARALHEMAAPPRGA